jgi:hypothetical protein
MSLESRIRTQLENELQRAPAASGFLDTVLHRGRRRRLAYRTTQGLAVAAALVLAVATTALVVKAMSSTRLVASPMSGTELQVISESPLVIQAEPDRSTTDFVPEGTEITFAAIEELRPREAAELIAHRQDPTIPIVAIGEIDGQRLFAVHTPKARLVLFDNDGSIFTLESEFFHTLHSAVDTTLAVGQPLPQTAFGQVTFGDTSYWQRTVEGLLLMPYVPPPTGGGTFYLYDDTGTVIDERTIGDAAAWATGIGLVQLDPAVWETRLEQACAEGVWEQEVAERLAAGFIAEDLATVEQVDGILDPTPEAGAQMLWIMSERYCGETFPPGAIDNPWFGEVAEAYVVPPPGTIEDWTNNLGLQQTDEALWADRLTQACDEGIWELAVAERLAAQFIAEDMELAVIAEGSPEPDVREGAEALWRMSVQYCRDAFPEGAIAAGPFAREALEDALSGAVEDLLETP